VIVASMIVEASGSILTNLMAAAMNRSIPLRWCRELVSTSDSVDRPVRTRE